MLPLQLGVPGGPELLVIVMMFFIILVLPVAVVLYIVNAFRKWPSAERVDELERQVGRLGRRVEELEGREDSGE